MQVTVDARQLKLLTYAKYLYGATRSAIFSSSPIVAAEALLRLHDAIEIFQLVVLEKIGVSNPRDVKFMEFWQRVLEKTPERYEPPYKERFRHLSDMRADFKHGARLPNLSEFQELSAIVPSFFEEVTKRLLGLDFPEISLADLIDDEAVRQHVRSGEMSFGSGDFQDALAELAIAFDLLSETRGSLFPEFEKAPPFNIYAEDQRTLGQVDRNFKFLESQVGKQLGSLKEALEIVAWDIDFQCYKRFRSLVPAALKAGGEYHKLMKVIPPVKDEVEFCLQFVVDAALTIQQLNIPVKDSILPRRIRTTATPTYIYEFKHFGQAGTIGKVDEGTNFVARFVRLPGALGEGWWVEWEGKSGIIRLSEASVVEESK